MEYSILAFAQAAKNFVKLLSVGTSASDAVTAVTGAVSSVPTAKSLRDVLSRDTNLTYDKSKHSLEAIGSSVSVVQTQVCALGGRQEFLTGSGTWVATVYSVDVLAVGGGGGGGGHFTTDQGGGGGGGGAVGVYKGFKTVPGRVYNYSIGTGGLGGNSAGGLAGHGGATSFSNIIVGGGIGGTPDYFPHGTGGGGSAFLSYAGGEGGVSPGFPGSDGVASEISCSTSGAGGGASKYTGAPSGAGGNTIYASGGTAPRHAGGGGASFGAGGNGGNNSDGVSAAANSGGGGGGGNKISFGAAGGNGGSGYLLLTW